MQLEPRSGIDTSSPAHEATSVMEQDYNSIHRTQCFIVTFNQIIPSIIIVHIHKDNYHIANA